MSNTNVIALVDCHATDTSDSFHSKFKHCLATLLFNSGLFEQNFIELYPSL